MGESWYEQEPKGAEEPKRYYAQHSGEALTLCFDHVETRPANYLGLFVPPPSTSKPDRKPRPKPRFAIMNSDGESLSILGPHSRKTKWKPGEPLSLITGRMNNHPHEVVIQILPRADGQSWDRTLPGVGVVTRALSSASSMHVFAGKEISDITVDRDVCPSEPIAVGTEFSCS
ncbi:MAG: hypothetical protein IPP28_00355 [Xanthomonadales bacterium]|nr:hypothetical protein [Xanthomonadales bacterium]